MKLAVTPETPVMDTPLRIRLDGLVPRGAVTLTASCDLGDRSWASSAAFMAAADGSVDLTRDAPLTGSYSGVDPMGLVWSMAPAAAAEGDQRLRLTATVDSGQSAETYLDRHSGPPGIAREVVEAGGLVGVLRYPESGPPRPGIILIGGAEGGLHEPDAALLAAHGFSVLALAYFGTPGLPGGLVRIPLEYFGTAIDWLLAHDRVSGNQVGITGGSRGGEAALLVGSTFAQIGAVVCLVGSGVLTGGIPYDRGNLLDILRAQASSWTWRGEPLPNIPYVIPPELERLVAAGEPVPLRLAFPTADRDLLAQHAIEVERIRGPVLMQSAEDDAGWDTLALCEVAMARFDRAHHPWPYEHVIYPGAGHAIAPPPYGPTTAMTGPGPGVSFAVGGSPAATAAAREAQWRRAVGFFTEHLGA